MYVKFYIPLFFSRPYETAVAHQLARSSAKDPKYYSSLLHLQKQVSQTARSIHQLQGVEKKSTWFELESQLTKLIGKKLNNSKIEQAEKNSLMNCFAKMKNELSNASWLTFASVVNMISNSLVLLLSGAGVGMGILMIATGPLGTIAFGVGLAIISAALITFAAYSLYVEISFMSNRQINQIDSFIQEITSSESPEVDPSNAPNAPTM